MVLLFLLTRGQHIAVKGLKAGKAGKCTGRMVQKHIGQLLRRQAVSGPLQIVNRQDIIGQVAAVNVAGLMLQGFSGQLQRQAVVDKNIIAAILSMTQAARMDGGKLMVRRRYALPKGVRGTSIVLLDAVKGLNDLHSF